MGQHSSTSVHEKVLENMTMFVLLLESWLGLDFSPDAEFSDTKLPNTSVSDQIVQAVFMKQGTTIPLNYTVLLFLFLSDRADSTSL